MEEEEEEGRRRRKRNALNFLLQRRKCEECDTSYMRM
jgi:hypothetical protein